MYFVCVGCLVYLMAPNSTVPNSVPLVEPPTKDDLLDKLRPPPSVPPTVPSTPDMLMDSVVNCSASGCLARECTRISLEQLESATCTKVADVFPKNFLVKDVTAYNCTDENPVQTCTGDLNNRTSGVPLPAAFLHPNIPIPICGSVLRCNCTVLPDFLYLPCLASDDPLPSEAEVTSAQLDTTTPQMDPTTVIMMTTEVVMVMDTTEPEQDAMPTTVAATDPPPLVTTTEAAPVQVTTDQAVVMTEPPPEITTLAPAETTAQGAATTIAVSVAMTTAEQTKPDDASGDAAGTVYLCGLGVELCSGGSACLDYANATHAWYDCVCPPEMKYDGTKCVAARSRRQREVAIRV